MLSKDTNISAVTVDQMVNQLSKAYVALIENDLPLKLFPSVMLWGPPGVGKSQGIKKLAEVLSDRCGKTVAVTDVRLLLFNPVDLRGIPTANDDKTLAVWLKPKIFQMDPAPDVINILFLDEISAAPQSVQAAAYQITLDRTIGEHKLPENCIVIAAGNRVTDKSVAYNMPKALANRLCHLEIRGDPDSWHDWAVSQGLHKYVTGYLEYNSVALMRFEPAISDLAFPTPRSWEMASNILTHVSDDISKVYPLLVGCIGVEAVSALKNWAELYHRLPTVQEILSDQNPRIPKEPELQLALRTELVDYARSHPDKKVIDDTIAYACRLPWSFRGKLLHDYYYTPSVRSVVKANEVFQDALRRGLQ